MPGLRVKTLFFDRAKVINALDAADRRVLSKIGAFVRTRARSLLGRATKKIAAPGTPPNTHEGSLKRLLFFSYDPQTKSVVIGPTPFRYGKAPNLLEFGGRTTLQLGGKSVPAVYRPHPYMAPSLAAEEKAGTIPQAWSGSVRS